jgi:hypothetical protein
LDNVRAHMAKREPTVVSICLTVTGATPGIDANSEGALARSLRALIQLGRPIQSTAVCYFAPASGDRLCWLGVFVETVGGQVLFFPDLRVNSRSITTRTDTGPLSRKDFRVDHISLEPNRRRWHFTQHDEPRDHIRAGITHSVDGCVVWAGMTVARRYLRDVHEETQVSAAVPASDVDRRLSHLRPLLVNQPQQIVSLSSKGRQDLPSFHCAFVVGSRDAPDYRGPLLLPTGSPFLRKPISAAYRRALPARLHRVPLSDATTVQLITVPLPSDLTVPITFTSLHRRRSS